MLRGLGPFVDESSLFFAVEGRSRRSVTCNLRDEPRSIAGRRLISTADVVCENSDPDTRTVEPRSGKSLATARDGGRVDLGQSGPNFGRPGPISLQSRWQACSRSPDTQTVRGEVGVTMADHLTAVFAAQAALAALVARRRTGRGAVIDVPLHGSVLRCLETTLAAFDRLGLAHVRTGSQGPHQPPSGVYATEDERFVAIAIDTEHHLRALRVLLASDAAVHELRPDVESCAPRGRQQLS